MTRKNNGHEGMQKLFDLTQEEVGDSTGEAIEGILSTVLGL